MSSWRDYRYPNKYTQTGSFGMVRLYKESHEDYAVPSTPLDGLTVIITGANTGVGLEAARYVAELNAANLIIAVRTASKGEAAKETILKKVPATKTNIQVLQLDMTSFASVKSFGDEVKAAHPKIDIAILNAGVAKASWEVTKDGWEQTIQVNDLSTIYLALLLFPAIRAAYDKSKVITPVIEIVTSDVHYTASFPERKYVNEKMGLMNALNDKSKSSIMDRYFVSKLIEVFFVRAMADWIESKNLQDEIIITSCNPGPCKSELNRRETKFPQWLITAILYHAFKRHIDKPAEMGARSYLWAATKGKETMGQYTSVCEVQRPVTWVASEEGEKVMKKLWEEIGEILIGVDSGSVKEFFQ